MEFYRFSQVGSQVKTLFETRVARKGSVGKVIKEEYAKGAGVWVLLVEFDTGTVYILERDVKYMEIEE